MYPTWCHFQLLSSLLANHFLPDELQDAWDTNSIFLGAIFIAVLGATVTSQVQALEAFVMLQIMFAFLLSVFSGAARRWVWFAAVFDSLTKKLEMIIKAHDYNSVFGDIWRMGLGTALACYNVWFWFAGKSFFMDQSSCNADIFLFTRLSIRSPAQYFFKVLAVIYLVWKACSFLTLARRVPQFTRAMKSRRSDESISSHRQKRSCLGRLFVPFMYFLASNLRLRRGKEGWEKP